MYKFENQGKEQDSSIGNFVKRVEIGRGMDETDNDAKIYILRMSKRRKHEK